MNNKRKEFSPNYTVCPGETLIDVLDALSMSQSELAQRTGLTRKTINLIVKGTAPITVDTAMLLEHVLPYPVSFWTSLEAQHTEIKAREVQTEVLKDNTNWLVDFPIAALAKHGFIVKSPDKVEQLRKLLGFFGVSSIEQWSHLWNEWEINYRKSPSFVSKKKDVICWLRCGEILAKDIECVDYDSTRFKQALLKIRELTTSPFKTVRPRIENFCRQAGVAVVFVHELGGSRISGATRWLSKDKAIMQFTLRGKKDDLFWFAFFHEAAHILLHGRKQQFKDVFIEDGDTKTHSLVELEADEFAQNALIPREKMAEFIAASDFSREAILDFSSEINIVPGAVVGQLQHRSVLPWNTSLNKLKRKYSL